MDANTQLKIFGSVIIAVMLLALILIGKISDMIDNRKMEKEYIKNLERQNKSLKRSCEFYRNYYEGNRGGEPSANFYEGNS